MAAWGGTRPAQSYHLYPVPKLAHLLASRCTWLQPAPKIQKSKIGKPLMNSMPNSGFENVYILLLLIPSLTSSLRRHDFLQLQMRFPSALLNFAFRPPFYDIDNSHSAAVLRMHFIHNLSLNIGNIVNLRLGGERGHSYAHSVRRTLYKQKQCRGLAILDLNSSSV